MIHDTPLRLDSQVVRIWLSPPKDSDLPQANDLCQVAESVLAHFGPPRPPPPRLLCLFRYKDYTPLTMGEVSRALARSTNTSAPGLDHILHSIWKTLHHIKPSLLPSLLDPLPAHCFHPPLSKRPWASSLRNLASPAMTLPYPQGLLYCSIPFPRSSNGLLPRVCRPRCSHALSSTHFNVVPFLGDPWSMLPCSFNNTSRPFTASATRSPPFS